MKTILITGVGGLIGAAAAQRFHALGYRIVGIDCNLRGKLLGDEAASTKANVGRLEESLERFVNYGIDVRGAGLAGVIEKEGAGAAAIIHCAGQTGHGCAVGEDFSINVGGTVNLLTEWERVCPWATFVYMSTIGVYCPPKIECVRCDERYEMVAGKYQKNAFDETVPLDQGPSSFNGRSKLAADLYVQQFAYQYGLRAVCLRSTYVTGGMWSGRDAHGFLAHLARCAVRREPFPVYGFEGAQVRDHIHAADVAEAMAQIVETPGRHVVYNIGGGRENSCSILEAARMVGGRVGHEVALDLRPARPGDSPWWITDTGRLRADYPGWQVKRDLPAIFDELLLDGAGRW